MSSETNSRYIVKRGIQVYLRKAREVGVPYLKSRAPLIMTSIARISSAGRPAARLKMEIGKPGWISSFEIRHSVVTLIKQKLARISSS